MGDVESEQLVDVAIAWAVDDAGLRAASETLRQMSHGRPAGVAETVGLALGAWTVEPSTPSAVAGTHLVALGMLLRACPVPPQDLGRWIDEGRRRALEHRPRLAG